MGCVVDNVETIVNVGHAVRGRPVTHKYVSVVGEVRNPIRQGTVFNDQILGIDVPIDPETGLVDLLDRESIWYNKLKLLVIALPAQMLKFSILLAIWSLF